MSTSLIYSDTLLKHTKSKIILRKFYYLYNKILTLNFKLNLSKNLTKKSQIKKIRLIKKLMIQLLIILTLITFTALSANIYVTPDTTCSGCDGSISKPFTTILSALNIVAENDIIHLMKGNSGNHIHLLQDSGDPLKLKVLPNNVQVFKL